jgi:hypothetical protein
MSSQRNVCCASPRELLINKLVMVSCRWYWHPMNRQFVHQRCFIAPYYMGFRAVVKLSVDFAPSLCMNVQFEYIINTSKSNYVKVLSPMCVSIMNVFCAEAETSDVWHEVWWHWVNQEHNDNKTTTTLSNKCKQCEPR